MKKREITLITMFMFISMVLTTSIVFSALTGQSFVSSLDTAIVSKEALSLDTCTNTDSIADLEYSSDPHLQKLHEYQLLCDSFVADRVMIFIEMPKDHIVAHDSAVTLARTLKEFAYYGITPIVIVEPVTAWGLIDFEEFKSGFYNDWIHVFFRTLLQEGITDTQMGVWVPFPEANLPYWNHANANPSDFASIVNTYLGIMKTHFPTAHGSILLNSATYESDDFNWINGEYISLLPYVSGIDPKLVDSFGIQGFPWSPPTTVDGSGIYDAHEFLNPKLAIEAANELNVSEIWLNTGTYSEKYTTILEDTVTITASMRKDILTRIVSVGSQIQGNGFTVIVNVFAEDKSNGTEATNWSYLPENNGDYDHMAAFSDFLSQAEARNIHISFFDK